MAKKLENRWAEIVMITLVILVLILTSSCGTSKQSCGGTYTNYKLGNQYERLQYNKE